MTVLSDNSIWDLFSQHKISGIIHPLRDIQPASLDLHIWDKSVSVLEPGEMGLVGTCEEVTMPEELAGAIVGVSSNIRKGVLAPMGGFSWVDPGYCGTLTVAVINMGYQPYHLDDGARIAQLIFYKLDQPARHPYQGRYQNATSLKESAELDDSRSGRAGVHRKDDAMLRDGRASSA